MMSICGFLTFIPLLADLSSEVSAASSETVVFVGMEGRGIVGGLGFRDSLRCAPTLHIPQERCRAVTRAYACAIVHDGASRSTLAAVQLQQPQLQQAHHPHMSSRAGPQQCTPPAGLWRHAGQMRWQLCASSRGGACWSCWRQETALLPLLLSPAKSASP